LSLSGIRHRFEYNSNRENWILFLRQPCPFYYNGEQDSHFLRSPVCDFPIRSRIPLEKDEIPALRRLFQEIRHKTQSGLPQELAEAELLTCDLLRRFLKPEHASETHSAAIRFRERIDSDPDCRRSLDELAAETGYSRDHIRQLFVAEFGIPPGEYRIRQRLARIIRLIPGTDLSMKEIAAEVGLSHTSYLNQLIRKYYHTTPLELCRKLRRLSS
ncbi:MAG: helix-turn-helix transcriptional regulator, partial [Lentisphaeria bacterium]|nr:helix-turn-helix transcriptional regulator [Lentisphaeria bacterium]